MDSFTRKAKANELTEEIISEFIYNDPQYQPSQNVIETEAAIYEKFEYVK